MLNFEVDLSMSVDILFLFLLLTNYYEKEVFTCVIVCSSREISEDGKELLFDHGAPYFTVSNPDVLELVHEWESGGLVAEWKVNFSSFDCVSNKFFDIQQVCGHSLYMYSCSRLYMLCRHVCLHLVYFLILCCAVMEFLFIGTNDYNCPGSCI